MNMYMFTTPTVMEGENVDLCIGLGITIVSQIKTLQSGRRHALVLKG